MLSCSPVQSSVSSFVVQRILSVTRSWIMYWMIVPPRPSTSSSKEYAILPSLEKPKILKMGKVLHVLPTFERWFAKGSKPCGGRISDEAFTGSAESASSVFVSESPVPSASDASPAKAFAVKPSDELSDLPEFVEPASSSKSVEEDSAFSAASSLPELVPACFLLQPVCKKAADAISASAIAMPAMLRRAFVFDLCMCFSL